MPYLKNIQSTVLTINIPLTGNKIILFPDEISEELTDEESLAPEVQRAVKNRAAVILDSIETANVCSRLIYKGLAKTGTFPTNPQKGWLIAASENCTTPDSQTMESGWIALYNGSNWFVYCGL